MRTQLTTRCLLSVALCTLALGSPAWAGGGFFDDFSDGSIQDASPVTWWMVHTDHFGAPGNCLVAAEGLELTPDWPAQYGSAMWRVAVDAYGRPVHYTGNLTIRTQVKIGEGTTTHGSSVGLWFRGMDNKGYEFVINTMFLWFVRADGPKGWYSPMDTWHYPMNGSLDAKNDVMIQIDVIDLTDTAGHRTTSRLEARWWVVGQEMPVQPQLTVHDATYEAGEIAIGADCDSELNRTTIFRWVEVIGTEVEAEPIVDFNGDGTVGSSDLLPLIESWGQADPAVDLVPDGIVDQQDLEVLMDHWQQDVNEAALLAHWALDETQGTIASDSTGLYDATLVGSPAWDPEGGRTGGALRLDGLDDCAVAPFVVNPAEGAFSILAWVKGGAPGQVLFSQAGGTNWLRAAPTDGCLMTEAKVPVGVPTSSSLRSQAIITDGEWHRVGLVRDGVAKSLYVDDVVVAEDTQTRLAACTGGVLIGRGSGSRATGTYWKGLIDDVRIYNRAVRP